MEPIGCEPEDAGLQDRVHYFSGKILDGADLEQEQRYLLAKHRRHNRLLHGWGVVTGLDVTPSIANRGQVAVGPGYALDPDGNEIVVGAEVVVDASNRAPSFVAVRFDECMVDDRRIRETFAIGLLEEPVAPWVVLAKVSAAGHEPITVDPSVRRALSLD